MKNVTETLIKGMSPFALALLLAVSPAAHADDMAKEGDMAKEETVTQETKEMKKVKKAKKGKKHHARGMKRKHHHVSNPNGASNHSGEDAPEAEVDFPAADGQMEELDVRAPGQVE